MSLHAITVNENAYAIGKTLREISDPESLLAIKVLTRGTTRYPEPDPEIVIQAGDVLVLFATPEALYLLGEKILRGI